MATRYKKADVSIDLKDEIDVTMSNDLESIDTKYFQEAILIMQVYSSKTKQDIIICNKFDYLG